jgi:hypothetical protein
VATDAVSWTRTRAKIANHRRNHPDGDPPPELYRDHAAARLEAHILAVVAAAPPLTAEQRDRLAVLLRTTPPGGGGRTNDRRSDRPRQDPGPSNRRRRAV